MRTTSRKFRPRFCPNPKCEFHGVDQDDWPFERYGFFERKAAPRRIQRFRCQACNTTFSSQTFDTTYYLKRPKLQRPLFNALVSCAALRQASRALGCAHSTMQRQASRLGRHALLFEWKDGLREPKEELVLDGLRTFEFSQYWPFDLNLLVGADSYYVYGFAPSQLRRSGRMTAFQKKKRGRLEERHGKPSRRATEEAVKSLLVHFLPPSCQELTLRSDEHGDYPRAVRACGRSVTHVRISSKRRRDPSNPLFAINLLDRLVRHSSSDHKRETIAFAKRVQGAMERVAVLVAWRNHVKRRSERKSQSLTPSQRIGRFAERLTVKDLLARRLFPTRVELPAPAREVYWRTLTTRQIPNGTTHALKRAA